MQKSSKDYVKQKIYLSMDAVYQFVPDVLSSNEGRFLRGWLNGIFYVNGCGIKAVAVAMATPLPWHLAQRDNFLTDDFADARVPTH